ncbi:MAG: glycoside hydrolase N-terminal domain-containing protein, partial [Clostridia bacterium]|nr:glycoside hydrolase N-terminal domain-containing protein [Clostridia bacterium]
MDHILHLENPAARWDDASPLGCGSLGAMVYGGDGTETISLSEESIWSSNPPFDGDPEFRAKIERLRDLFRGGDISSLDDDAQRLLGDSMRVIASCEYAGAVTVAASLAGETADYFRDLD